MSTPRISVLMSVYNGERFLCPAMDSLLQQTFGDFELIVIDDGSTDSSPQLLQEYAQHDSRVRLVTQQNQGLTRSLNNALRLATGDYVARMDADDICHAERFEKQVSFLDAQPSVVAVGTAIEMIDAEGRTLGVGTVLEDPQQIDRAHLDACNSLAHPTIMVRRESINRINGYSECYRTSQDLDLYLRLADLGELSNLPEPLLKYRWHDGNVSIQKATQQDADVTAIVAAAHQRRGLPVPVGVPKSRWQIRRVLAVKYARNHQYRIALNMALQAIRMRPLSLRSWYTLLTLPLAAKRTTRPATP